MKNNLNLETIQNLEIFNPLSSLQKEEILRKSSLIKVARNRKVYLEDVEFRSVYIVVEGAVKLGLNASNGKTLIKHIAYAQDLFGENIFAHHQVRNEFAEVMKDAVLISVPIHTFKQIVGSNFQFAQSITKIIIERLHNIEQRMQSFVFLKAKRRIVEFIKKTASFKGINIGIDEILINHGMSHKEIAFLTDTSRQTVARVLGELKKENIIHFSARKPSKILIRDMIALG